MSVTTDDLARTTKRLRQHPLDYGAWLEVAALLAALGNVEDAEEVFAAIGEGARVGGQVALAVACGRHLAELGSVRGPELIDQIVDTYAEQKPARARTEPPVPSGEIPLASLSAGIASATALANIPQGTLVHNVELKPGRGGQLARSAGAAMQVVAKEGEYVSVKMPSGEIRKILQNCLATIGQVGNLDFENVSIGKAGRNRWLGKKPHVRGVAMNPVDHPLGGGEGRTSGGRHPVTPWGVPTKGYKTRSAKKLSNKFIVQRRKK